MELVESIKLCEKIWQWLADNPVRSNMRSLSTKANAFAALRIPELENNCPCCSYVDQFEESDEFPDNSM